MRYISLIFHNIWFLICKSFKYDRKLVCASALKIFINILLALCTAYLTKNVVLIAGKDTEVNAVFIHIFSFISLIFVLNIINNYATAQIKYGAMFTRLGYMSTIAGKNMDADFQNVESPSGQLRAQKAMNAVFSSNSGVEQIFNQLADMASSLIGIVFYSVIMLEQSALMGTTILSLMLFGILDFFAKKSFSKWRYNNRNHWTEYDRRINYLNKKVGDYRAAKDIRLFRMKTWLETM